MKELKGFVHNLPTGLGSGYFLKVPSKYLVGKLRANRWVNYKSNLNGPDGPMMGILVQNP